MDRLDFYRTYDRVTDGRFSDRICWSKEDCEQAWRRGQLRTSKLGRRLEIAGQYLALLGALVCIPLGEYGISAVCCVLFLWSAVETDFSIVKMEVLYRIYREGNAFSGLLYQAFLGNTDVLWNTVKLHARNRVSGFAIKKRRKLEVTYRVVFRKGRRDVFLTVKPSGIRLRTEGIERVWNDPAVPLEEMAVEIGEALNGL